MHASFSGQVYDAAIQKFAQIWTPMRWGKLESHFAVGLFTFGLREHMRSENGVYILALSWRRQFHMGAIPNVSCCVWNAPWLVRGQNIPCKGEGAELVSHLTVNLCPSGLSCGHFSVARPVLDMPFQWGHCKISLLLSRILEFWIELK